ncbi:MAG: arylsulfatase A-like enzyme [Neolewinella sp.]
MIMRRPLFLALVLCAAVTAQEAGRVPARPNVILVMADDLGWGDLGCFGHPDVKTPHLDALANEGHRFTRFHAAAPVCSPTRASCLTGRHPYRAGIRGANSGHLGADEVTLQGLLGQAGYRTGHFGKWHLGTLTKTLKESNRGGPRGVAHFAPPWQRGFDVCFSTEAKVPTFDPMKSPKGDKPYGTHYWNQQGELVTDNLDGDDSRVIMDRVLPFVRGSVAKADPFFAVVWFHAPHLPVVASEADRKPYAQFDELTQHYYGCITALDREVGRLRTTLDELGVRDNTILWFCSDNGPEGKKGKAPGSAGSLRGRKRSLFEGGTRVPGILSWPKQLPTAQVVDTLACTSDFLPTIAHWLDLKIPAELVLDGVNLASLIGQEAAGKQPLRKQPIGFESARLATWTTDRFKLVAHLGKTPKALPTAIRLQLFDLLADPTEASDISAKNGFEAIQLNAQLSKWRESIRKRP